MVLSKRAPYEVFKRADSANWWMRFSLPNQGQIRLPLKTSDHHEALSKAVVEYQRAVFQAEHDLLPGKMSFDKVALGFLDSIKAEPTNKKAHATWVSHKGVIDRYLIPYFGKTPIAGLTEPKLYAFVDWRRTFWTKGPGKDLKFIQYERGGRKLITPARHEEPKLSTLRREAVTLRAVFNFAARKGFINRGAIPKLGLEKEETNKRPSFTNAEINALLTIAEQRIAEMSDHPKLRYERIVLFCFVAIAVDTGMRPTELYNLNWANIVGFAAERTKPLAHRRIRIQAYGKGFQPRELVPNVGVFGAFENLWELYLQHHGEAPADGDPIFRNIDGDRLGSIKNSLNQLLDATKLKQDAFGRARTAYSLRHTYASNQIRKGTDVYTLAINMRTSVRMIETYYSDVLPADLAKQLEGSFD